MITTRDFKTGLTIELDGELYTIVNYDHTKPGKGGAYLQTELKHLESGRTVNKRFKAGEKVQEAYIDTRPFQYLYQSGEDYVFMDQESYEQINLSQEQIGDAAKFIKENSEIKVKMYQNEPIGVKLPTFVELEVTHAPPAVKGNTVSGGSKKVTVETGAEVKVPLFIEEGDILKLDTRSCEYIERV
ncbi:translation elongation factor P [Halobacteroides halobius DSM 5150]|uniref:Elongation factor P n=1 Tax=Halobacteroides halobius (strain ATCC 35273 / DSM 5150 / MD-1) TaxID=748449 RepID=L0K7I1_HALHC|nr:elongation factor P [Halobacteroides halobius]AGB40505.1 translation elongation factor P [Halobacteroides halobius DSM 5150]